MYFSFYVQQVNFLSDINMQPLREKLDACLHMLDCGGSTNNGDINWLNVNINITGVLCSCFFLYMNLFISELLCKIFGFCEYAAKVLKQPARTWLSGNNLPMLNPNFNMYSALGVHNPNRSSKWHKDSGRLLLKPQFVSLSFKIL